MLNRAEQSAPVEDQISNESRVRHRIHVRSLQGCGWAAISPCAACLAKWDELREVFNTKEGPRPRHTTRPHIDTPTQHTKSRRNWGRQLSTLYIHLSCACRKCCRPARPNIPSSLACQHEVRQHNAGPDLPPHRPSQAHASQVRNSRWIPLHLVTCATAPESTLDDP